MTVALQLQCICITPGESTSLHVHFRKIKSSHLSPRFHSFLLFLGHPAYSVREVSVHRFSKILSEFALEYRTTRDRVLQQKQKRADHRERNKTRGKMIMDVNAPVSITHTHTHTQNESCTRRHT